MAIKSALLAVSVALPITTFGATNITEDTGNSQLQVKIRSACSIALNPIIVDAVVDQNSQNLSQEIIQKRDKEWRSDNKLTPLKYSLQSNRAGKILKSYVDNNPAFKEAFLTDNQGANVATYPSTSDYWQGDEEHWKASYNNGNGKVHINSIDKDKKTDEESMHISSPVLDKDGKTVGVLIMGINVNHLSGRMR